MSGESLFPEPSAFLDAEGFIRAHTRLQVPPLVPEMRLFLADELTPLWQATEDTLGKKGLEPPFWAFAWPGSQGMARWILDNPQEVAGKRVLDIGAGGGLAAIAAARAGARAIANDVDPMAIVAARLNAAENGVTIEGVCADLLDTTLLDTDLDAEFVIVGDLCYERALSERLLAWLHRLARTRRVLMAEPGRAFAPRAGVRPVGTYVVPTLFDLENRTERTVVLLEIEAG
ncbi:MAG: 50S ribosomal protein L11 methyltransferase [Pseudomonadota bacterium]|nr:50S ribosomal protein L11 methyltransferase [Pseudomonadota bacterium]